MRKNLRVGQSKRKVRKVDRDLWQFRRWAAGVGGRGRTAKEEWPLSRLEGTAGNSKDHREWAG